MVWFHLEHVDIQFSQHHSLKKTSCATHKVCCLHTSKKISIFYRVGFIVLAYIPVLMPVPYCFDFYSFVEYSEVSLSDDSNFILLIQDCFGYSVHPVLSKKF